MLLWSVMTLPAHDGFQSPSQYQERAMNAIRRQVEEMKRGKGIIAITAQLPKMLPCDWWEAQPDLCIRAHWFGVMDDSTPQRMYIGVEFAPVSTVAKPC